MAVRGCPPPPRGVLAFDAPEWQPPEVVLLDTNVVAEAPLANQPEHSACLAVLERLGAEGTTVMFSRLLEIELWEVVFNLALRERHPGKDLRHRPRRCRRAGPLLARRGHRAVCAAPRDTHRTREKASDMRYPQGIENGLHRSNGAHDVAQIARGDRLVDATPEALRELAESAMLLSQGARRAIEMKRAANNGSTDPTVPATPAAAEARPS